MRLQIKNLKSGRIFTRDFPPETVQQTLDNWARWYPDQYKVIPVYPVKH